MRAAGSYMEGKRANASVNRHSILKVSPNKVSVLRSAAALAGQSQFEQASNACHNAYLNMPAIDAKYSSKDRFGKNKSAMESAKSYH